jgi:ABC-type multidrug transport system permease subunit
MRQGTLHNELHNLQSQSNIIIIVLLYSVCWALAALFFSFLILYTPVTVAARSKA